MVPGTGWATKKKRKRNKRECAQKPGGFMPNAFFGPQGIPYFCTRIDEK
jgi:hypothetical protein